MKTNLSTLQYENVCMCVCVCAYQLYKKGVSKKICGVIES